MVELFSCAVLDVVMFAALCVQVAQEFLDGCSRSLVEVCRSERVPWEVTTCGWSEDEEQDRITR